MEVEIKVNPEKSNNGIGWLIKHLRHKKAQRRVMFAGMDVRHVPPTIPKPPPPRPAETQTAYVQVPTPPENDRAASRASSVDRAASPVKKDEPKQNKQYHWLTWRTTPTPQPESPVPHTKVPIPPATPMFSPTPTPKVPKSAWSTPPPPHTPLPPRPKTASYVYRPASGASVRSAPATPAPPSPTPYYRAATPADFSEVYRDNMTCSQAPPSPMNIPPAVSTPYLNIQ